MKLRADEQFVMKVLVEEYSGTWEPGEDPPDAYLKIDNQIIAVEISTLSQHVLDDNKGFIPRLSHDTSALSLIDELNDELSASIPSSFTALIHLNAPLKNKRKLKPILTANIMEILEKDSFAETGYELNILSNQLTVKTIPMERPSGKKVIGFVSNHKSSPNILSNARQILESRIETKKDKCKGLYSKGLAWLALLNDYWLADENTYKQAIELSAVAHSFDKILMVSDNKAVVPLFEN